MARPIPDLELMEANEAALDDRVIIDDTSDAETKAMEIEQLLKLIIPTGLITPFGGASAPDGFLLCDGANVSRTTYADLFAVIGTNYGNGDGSSTFGLPNLKGRVPVGLDTGQTEFNTLGKNGGTKSETLVQNQLPASFNLNTSTSNNRAGSVTGVRLGYGSDSDVANRNYSFTNSGGSQPINNIQPYLTANYIIKS